MTNSEVTWLTLEEAPQRLWCEFLGGYFDGQAHAIIPGGSTFTFPKASFAFDQSALTQPMDGSGVNIAVVGKTIKTDSGLEEIDGVSSKHQENQMRWEFYVRAANIPAGQGNPAYVCRQAAQLLRALLINDVAIHPLAQKGIYDLSVQESEPVESVLYAVRRLRVHGIYHYSIPQE